MTVHTLEAQALRALVNASDPPTLADHLAEQLKPWSDEELEASSEPHPHVFSADNQGLFPISEVSVLGARGREGKTTVLVAIAAALATDRPLAGLMPISRRSAVIYSAEDDRRQFARKVAAQRAGLPPHKVESLKRRILVPDLEASGMEELRRLVTEVERKPISTGTDKVVIDALRPLMRSSHPPVLIIFETASTLTDTEENNQAYAALIDCLKRIARALGVAVVLVHHTSQASDATLADLSINSSGIRGGTTLIYNSRQNLLLVDLGSEADPFPSHDARTALRNMVAPDEGRRISVLVAMETSKASDPPPLWFCWIDTAYGPAAIEVEAPEQLIGLSWRKVRGLTMAARTTRREESKKSAQATNVAQVIQLVEELDAEGKQPTARAVSIAAGRSETWATPYLNQAARDGKLRDQSEKVPRRSKPTTVYRPIDSTG